MILHRSPLSLQMVPTWPAPPDMPDTLPASELPSTSRCGGERPLTKRLNPGGGAPRSTARCSISSAVRVRLPAGLLLHSTGNGGWLEVSSMARITSEICLQA